LAPITPVDGWGWYGAAPLALFNWPFLMRIGRILDRFLLACEFIRLLWDLHLPPFAV
jgi:hypothetical protein